MQYTSEQHAILSHSGSHARVIAVAGSGKTQTLTAYVQQRLLQGANPRRVLVLMYNKAAQVDFERRLRLMVGDQQPIPDIRTFHSLGYRICQSLVRQGDLPAFDKNILNDYEIEPIVWRILRQLAEASLVEDVLSRKNKWVEPAMAYFERVKSSLASPEAVFLLTGLPKTCQFFIEAFYQFEDWRSQNRRMSFADLIYDPVQRFLHEPHLAKTFSGHMEEIIVDEFQDINPVQSFLLETLHGQTGRVTVVGDPDQTIYEFRGSTPSLLTHEFHQSYTPVTDFQLSHTFRFGSALSLLANQVIASNYDAQSDRTFCQSHDATPQTKVIRLPIADSAEAALQQIVRWSATRSFAEIAVINRLWANSARLELLLLVNAIPYHMDHSQTVLERHELKPFRVLLNIAGGQAFEWSESLKRNAWRILLTQPYLKIKKTIIDDLIHHLATTSQYWGRELRRAMPDSLTKYQSEELFERARILEKAERGRGEAYDVIQAWIRSTDYYAALKDTAFSAAQIDEQVATVKAFASFVRQSRWPLAKGADELSALATQKTPSDADAVLITSIHKAKGREWPCVIIPELNSRYFPYQPESDMAMESSVESERRLLYVAITRAKEELVLLTPSADSEVTTSPLLPDAYVDGLSLVNQALRGGCSSLKLPHGMHKPTVQRFAELNKLDSIEWVGQKKRTGLTHAYVHHPALGRGQIVRESKQRLWIQFAQPSTTREFDRVIVLPLLTILPD